MKRRRTGWSESSRNFHELYVHYHRPHYPIVVGLDYHACCVPGATLRALEACRQLFYLGSSETALILDNVVEVSVGDFPVAVVMITASEKAKTTPLVAACPLVGMSDLAIILATLQATARTVSHWLTWGDRYPGTEEQDGPH